MPSPSSGRSLINSCFDTPFPPFPSPHRLSSHISLQFSHLGLVSSTQTYTTSTSLGSHSGTNVWASLVPPRTGGTEAIVLAASWESLAFQGGQFESELGGVEGERMHNLRGIATLLALAEYLRGTFSAALLSVLNEAETDLIAVRP
jgi:hypothetical protein